MIVNFTRLDEAKAKPAEPEAKGKVVFYASKDFKTGLAKHKGAIGAKLADFIKQKSQDPMSKFGAKDQHFTGGGPLTDSGVIHAHLNHDVQVLYRRSGKNPTKIELLALGSHDDFGTGQPPNMKKQKGTAKAVDQATTEPLKESKGNVLNTSFSELRSRYKAFKQDEGEALSREELSLLKTLKHIKDREVWETSGPRAPAYGPALSNKVSATREVVLQKRSPDGKILVAQRSDALTPGDDTMARTFGNTEQGYEKALRYYISLTR